MIPKFYIGQALYYCQIPLNINRQDYEYSIYRARIASIYITPKDCSEAEKGIKYAILYEYAAMGANDEYTICKEREEANEYQLFEDLIEASEFVAKHFKEWNDDCVEDEQNIMGTRCIGTSCSGIGIGVKAFTGKEK